MLKIQNVTKKYGNRVVLDNINVTFEDKGLYFVIGDSGSGKTSLLNIIGKLDYEYEGSVLYGKNEKSYVNIKGVSEYHEKIVGFVFQEYNLINYLTLRENLEIAVKMQNKSVDNKDIDNIIKKLNIENVNNNLANQLSGGEKQRTALARILCRDSNIILADEPTGNLDEENTINVIEELKKISEKKLVIVVTHNESMAHKYGDHILEVTRR